MVGMTLMPGRNFAVSCSMAPMSAGFSAEGGLCVSRRSTLTLTVSLPTTRVSVFLHFLDARARQDAAVDHGPR